MPDKLTIRQATVADAAVIAEIYNESIAAGRSTMDDELKSRADIRRQIESFSPRESYWLLERGSEVLGWGVIKKFEDHPDYRYTCETSVYLRHSLIRKGYGSRIKRVLVQRCRESGYHHLVARIFAGNRGSIEYNRRFGYQIVGIQKEIGCKNGKWQDIALLQLVLDDSSCL